VVALLTVLTLLAVLAPIVAGPVPAIVIPHDCPQPTVLHGVGGNLKTFAKKVDLCARNVSTKIPGAGSQKARPARPSTRG
jgi:hypothetical protein